MRLLLCLHHRLRADRGAPGATLALGSALERQGCRVEYFSFDEAFKGAREESVIRQLRFPWRVAGSLLRRARRFDVVDASTGDAWVWATLRRSRMRPAALVTRSHGLEPLAHQHRLRSAREGGAQLSRRYPLYHGGLRLWEVRRSLRLADHCIVLNGAERDYVRDRLSVSEERVSVVPNGIADHFMDAPTPELRNGEGLLRLAFIGSWTDRKGRRLVEETVTSLEARGVEFSLRLLGTGDEAALIEDFPQGLRSRLEVTSHFANEDLPRLLADQDVFLFPTLFEGASVALLEAMACGLAPLATNVGSAPELVTNGENGLLVEPGDAPAIVSAVERLAGDRESLIGMRRHAQQTARAYGWDAVAARTLRIYERALAARSTADTKRGPTLRQE